MARAAGVSPSDFRAALSRLGLSQVGAARALNIDPRTVRRYCSGEYEVTRMMELALDGLEAERTASARGGTR